MAVIRRTIPTAAAAVLALISACAPARGAAPEPVPGPAFVMDTTRVTVTGTHSVRVAADRATIQVAVETEGPTAAAASGANAEAMNRVLRGVRPEAGPGGRIETSGFQLTPRYRQPADREAPPEIAGYRALNQLSVTLEEVDRVAGVLDAALAAGANRITGLVFFASDTEEARLEAVRRATEHARTEAEAVAGALGLRIASAETVSTSSGGRSIMLRGAAAELAMAQSTPVESGTESVDASVTVTFRLVPREER